RGNADCGPPLDADGTLPYGGPAEVHPLPSHSRIHNRHRTYYFLFPDGRLAGSQSEFSAGRLHRKVSCLPGTPGGVESLFGGGGVVFASHHRNLDQGDTSDSGHVGRNHTGHPRNEGFQPSSRYDRQSLWERAKSHTISARSRVLV